MTLVTTSRKVIATVCGTNLAGLSVQAKVPPKEQPQRAAAQHLPRPIPLLPVGEF